MKTVWGLPKLKQLRWKSFYYKNSYFRHTLGMHDAYRTTTPTNYIAFNNSYHNRSLFTFWQTNQFKQYLPFKMLNSLKGKKKKKSKIYSSSFPYHDKFNKNLQHLHKCALHKCCFQIAALRSFISLLAQICIRNLTYKDKPLKHRIKKICNTWRLDCSVSFKWALDKL